MKYLAALFSVVEIPKNPAFLSFAFVIIAMIRTKVSDLKGYLYLADRNKQLEDTNRELENQSKLKDKLLSIISHDIRGPLGSLKSLLHLLMRREITTRELQDTIIILDHQVEQLSGFLENLLRWAKSHQDQIKPNKTNIQIRGLVTETVELLSLFAHKKNVRIHCAVPEYLTIYADAEMIKLVLRNLISNAIKFCNAHDNIYVQAIEMLDGVCISVRDTGKGISKENQEKLFGISNLTTRGTKDEIGMGLGLILCREFIEKHEGKIHVSSEEDRGSCFEFIVPHPITKTQALTSLIS